MENYNVSNPRNDISFEDVSEKYEYDADSGEIRKRSNGRRLGYTYSSGYRYVWMFGRNRKEHRISWLLHYGQWPENQIDHINGDKSDNRIVNLKDATATENQLSKRWNKNNTIGFRGVRRSYGGKFIAVININNVRIHLGTFDNVEDASLAYEAKRSETLKIRTSE